MSKALTEEHFRVLREIQERIPRDLLDRLIKQEKQFTTLQQVLEIALDQPEDVVSAEEKRKFQDIIASGYLDKMIDVVDPDVEAQISALIEMGIKEAVDAGLLPKTAPALKLLKNKGPEYAKRQRKRLRRLYVGTSDGSDRDAEGSEAEAARGDARHRGIGTDDQVLPEQGGTGGRHEAPSGLEHEDRPTPEGSGDERRLS